jgi:SAM-dependent methyltransferase
VTHVDERQEFLDLLALAPGARLLEVTDAPLTDSGDAYDGILCIDRIARLPDRSATLAAWARALKPGGRVLYTDPAIIAGLVTGDEVAACSRGELFVLSPQGENEGLIEAAGLRLLRADDASEAVALQADVSRRSDDDIQWRFRDVTRTLAAERRLARIAFLAEKPK